MKVKLVDIARETGFSVNTVSRAMRDDKRISDATRERIVQKAKDLGYIRNAVASSMRSNRTHTIGIVSADSSNPFFAEVILGIEDTSRRLKYQILLMNTEENPENEKEAVRLLLGRQVDGLIVIPVYGNPETQALYKELDRPFVFAGRHVEGLTDHSILPDDREGARQVFDYLFDNGHKRILYLAGPKYVSNSGNRLHVLFESASARGVRVDPALVVETKGHLDDGYLGVNQALRQELNFTAVACFNDMVAMGALKSLHENGLSVPGEVEVIGYDNLSMAQFMQPRLSTVDVPKGQLGQLAVEELVKHIEQEELSYETRHLKPRLIFRETTRR